MIALAAGCDQAGGAAFVPFVVGDVPGMDAETFQSIVDEAAKLCPISRLFAGATITVNASFQAS